METISVPTLLHSIFPLSNQEGRPTIGINKSRITNLAKNSKPLSSSQLEQILEKHFDFLSGGGAGGEWQTILVKGLVLGLYNAPLVVKDGEQATFERANLSKVEIAKRQIPFANFCGVYKENGDFQNANLSYCLFTDSFLQGADFRNAKLLNSRFPGANLKNVFHSF